MQFLLIGKKNSHVKSHLKINRLCKTHRREKMTRKIKECDVIVFVLRYQAVFEQILSREILRKSLSVPYNTSEFNPQTAVESLR